MFKLSDLLIHKAITIQCHDNPDADAIASAYGLYSYFQKHNKQATIVYGGRAKITKSNLLLLIESFNIPIQHTESNKVEDLLITVDCQFGSGNVSPIIGDTNIIIDHHRPYPNQANDAIIASYLGSCSTLVWKLMNDEKYDFKEDLSLSTALYYGLFTDTSSLSEINHPLDKDMRDELIFNSSILRKLKNSNLNINEIEIAGIALMNYNMNENNRYAIFKAKPCDANILGFIVDLALQVDSLDTCVVYNNLDHGYKLSIRSCIKEIMASELAEYITEDIGSGGGHIEKAGGYISADNYNKAYPDKNFDDYLMNRIQSYYESYNVLYSNNHTVDISKMEEYSKLPLKLAFVPVTDLVKEGTPILIRTLECDMDLLASVNNNIIIGIKGEVYPITITKFNTSYTLSDEPINDNFEYFPSIKNKLTDETISLKEYAKTCYSTGASLIYALPLVKNTKVFTTWDPHKYMYGRPGDFLAIRQDDTNDMYIIEKSIFKQSYQKVY